MTVKEAAETLGVCYETIYNLHKRGEIDMEFVSDKVRLVKTEQILALKEKMSPKDMKKCKYCTYIGPKSDFAKNRNRCQKCHEEYERNRYYENKPKDTKRVKEYTKIHGERKRKRANDWYYQNKEQRSKHIRLKRYGLTENEFDNMVKDSGGLCAICKQPFDRICVDHCHKTEIVKNLLCSTCNSGIGFLKDDPTIVYSAYQYLMKYESKVEMPDYFANFGRTFE